MPMMADEQQTAVRRSRWKGQHGQDGRMAETLPDEDDEDNMDDEDNIDDEDDIEDIEEEAIEEEDEEEEES